MDTDKLKLYEFILAHYSMSELKDLCFYLGVVYDDLDGEARKDKARELVEYMARRRRLDDLRAVLGQQRPEQYGAAFPMPAVETFRRNVSTPTRSTRRIHEKTGIELIYIPAGPFLYGSADSDKMAFSQEKPQRVIDLPQYWIGYTPVTNRQYKQFLDANPSWRVPYYQEVWANAYNWDDKRRTYPPDKADYPVVLVSWEDARAFCSWAGLTLPTDEQWEKAARGTDGRIWPWGNEPPTAEYCNFNNNVRGTTPVGKYSPKGDSPYGCADMTGNVWEWTGSWYRKEKTRALRGGALNSYDLDTRAAHRGRADPHNRAINVGFRVIELLPNPGS